MPSTPASDKAQFNVYLPRDLITAIKHRGVDEGVSLSALVERVLREHLAATSTQTPAQTPAPIPTQEK